MAQKRIDGSDEPEKKSRQRLLQDLLLDPAAGIDDEGLIDYDAKVDEGIKRGIFCLDDVITRFRKSCAAELRQAGRKIRHKGGAPGIIPSSAHPGQDVLLDVAKTEDRFLNVLRRGLQTFGHHWVWKASVKDMEEREEETLPVAEFKEGSAQIQALYRSEAAALNIDPEEEPDDE